MKIIRKKKLIGNDSDTLLTNAVIGDVQKYNEIPFHRDDHNHTSNPVHMLKNLIQK